MGKIIVEAEILLERTMNAQEFSEQAFKYHHDDVKDYLNELLFVADALVQGRIGPIATRKRD